MIKITNKNELANLMINDEDITKYDYSSITDFSEMFYGSYLEEIPQLQNLDMSNVKTAESMFENCQKLKKVPKLNTNKLVNASQMFCYCPALEEFPDMNYSKIKNALEMFKGCTSLKNVPNINFKKVEECYGMFNFCSELKSCLVNVENAKSIYGMFSDCPNLEEVSKEGNFKNLQNITTLFYSSNKIKTDISNCKFYCKAKMKLKWKLGKYSGEVIDEKSWQEYKKVMGKKKKLGPWARFL